MSVWLRPALSPRNLSRTKPSSGSADVNPGGDNITISATFRHIDVFNRDLLNSIVRSFGTQCLLLTQSRLTHCTMRTKSPNSRNMYSPDRGSPATLFATRTECRSPSHRVTNAHTPIG